jgi:adenylate cyclase
LVRSSRFDQKSGFRLEWWKARLASPILMLHSGIARGVFLDRSQAMTTPDDPQGPSGRALLRRLLSERNQQCERSAEIDDQIRRTFERTVAVLVLDMVGFSRLSVKHGIIHYLSMIARMDLAARPAVEGNGGRVVKQEADNLFAVFDTPVMALEAALDILRSFRAINGVTPSESDIYGSIGIGHGPTLLIGEDDLFGCEVNFASKLGEDLAGASEIILSGAAHDALPPKLYRFEPAHYSVSGLEIPCHYFVSKLHPDGREILPTDSSGHLVG